MPGKVGRYTDVKLEKVSEDMAVKTYVRWLITEDDGAPTFAMRLFKVEKGGYIKAHKHPWEHEIFILRGKCRVRIDNEYHDVEAGYYIFIPPNAEHEYWNIGDSDLEFICLIPNKPSVEE